MLGAGFESVPNLLIAQIHTAGLWETQVDYKKGSKTWIFFDSY